MNAKLRSLVASLVAMAAGAASAADPVLWVSDSAGRLETINVVTGATSLVGNMGRAMFDIAFDPTGQLYGIDGSALYSIDSNTAAATLIGGSGGGNINSLVFGSDGTLYGASNALYKFNVANGSRAAVGPTFSGGVNSSGDLAFIAGNLYLSALSSPDRLVRLNTTTGANTDVGSIGFGSVFGLASPNGADLYGFSGGAVLSIDVGSGAGTLISTANGAPLSAVFGSAFFAEAAPTPAVPEPSTYALFAVGLAAVGFAARRQRAR